MDCMAAARFAWLIGVYRAAIHRATRCHRGTGSSTGISSSLTPSWTTGMLTLPVVQAACVSPEADTLAPVPMPVGVATGFNLEPHTGTDSDQPDSDSESDALARPMKKRAC